MGSNFTKKHISITIKRSNPGDNTFSNTNPQQIDYDKLKQAIVDAHNAIHETNEATKKKEFENDPLSSVLIETLKLIFGFIIALLILIALIIMLRSLRDVHIATNSNKVLWDNLILWLFFGVGATSMLHLTFKKPSKDHKWYPIISGATTLVPICIAFFNDEFLSDNPQMVSVKMTITGLLIIAIGFLVFLMRAVTDSHKNDRNYLVAFFAAIIALVALLIAAISFFLQLPDLLEPWL